MTKKQKVWIVLASPAGTTLRVAGTIKKTAEAEGAQVNLVDLAASGNTSDKTEELCQSLAAGDLLFVGSPTYANHALPLIMDFLARLPEVPGARAAVFTTYGMVSSGITLYEMASVLAEKGMIVLGGIKVPAAHSMLWQDEDQPGKNRPGDQDLAEVSRFAGKILEQSAVDSSPGISVDVLNYQRQEVREKAAESGLHVLKPMLLPMGVDEEACTECGLCVENCPGGNITLDPKPVFGDNCLVCFNCVRVCDEGAITNSVLSMIGPEIRKRMDFFQEPAEVRMFV
ncbi:MAG: EFR1 family ferrodoxin [Desulfosudaceae bacterium]